MFDKKARLTIISMFILAMILVGVLGSVSVVYGIESLIGDALYASAKVKKEKADIYASYAATTHTGGVVFLGDSIIDMYDLNVFFPGKGYINRGISGDKSGDIISRLDSNVIAVKPSKIIIICGINDMGYDVPLQEFLNNYNRIIDSLQLSLPGTEIVVQSLYPLRPATTMISAIGVKSRSNAKVLEWNISIAALAGAQGCKYIDMHSRLVDNKGKLAKKYTLEGLHINSAGYSVISQCLADIVGL